MKTFIMKNHFLSFFLYLVGLHSILVGIGLIILPLSYFSLFGFDQVTEKFFPVQGGVFHIVMSIAYFLAGRDPVKNNVLVIFSIIVKLCATIFLIVFYFTISSTWMILLSAIADCFMCVTIYYMYTYQLKKNNNHE